MGVWFYSICLVVETFGITATGLGLWEMWAHGTTNPACYLITIGSFLGCLGSAYFAKIIKWKRAAN